MAMHTAYDSPAWVRALLSQPWVLPVSRLILVSAYLIAGVYKLLDFNAAAAEQAHFGLHPGSVWAAMAIVVEIGGPLCVLSRRFTWLGAGGLGVLTLVAMLVAADFWNMTGTARFMALNAFFEHLGLIGGLVLVTVLNDRQDRAGSVPAIR
ncbi:DoxX family protein [Burkholderia cenocepacia]|uniref:DoxX family protein n=1 Tax=Burkholderia cenocepacia TaxID=95486 RepID=UPI001B98E698|nr:DoxX family protein [Burkholderia cenocepacia]MBR8411909.1 DoxX family protein [Burkholderia cenocepacia]